MITVLKKLHRVAVAVATYVAIGLLAALVVWSVVWTWSVVWRFVLVTLIATATYRITSVAQRWSVARVLATALVAIGFSWMIKGGHPDSQGEWFMLGALLFVPGWRIFGRRLPGFFAPPAANTPDAATEARSPREFTSDEAARLVDSLDAAWGSTRVGIAGPNTLGRNPRTGKRAVHTHGSWAIGSFTPTTSHGGDDEWISSKEIPMLGATSVPAYVRFSNFSGEPLRNDTAKEPHGMAVKLISPDDAGMDFVALDMKRFMVRTRDDFFTFMEYFTRHPILRAIGWLGMVVTGRTTVQAIKGMRVNPRAGYGDRTYHGQNMFWCTVRDPEGRSERIPVRYRFVPTHKVKRGTMSSARDRLDAELGLRLIEGPLSFRVELVDGRGTPEDHYNDPVRPWPANQPSFPFGQLRLTRFITVDEARGGLDRMVFNPHRLPEGIRPSDDEILMARRAAYTESHVRRTTGCPFS